MMETNKMNNNNKPQDSLQKSNESGKQNSLSTKNDRQDNPQEAPQVNSVPPNEQCLDNMLGVLDKMDWILEKEKACARIAELEKQNAKLKQDGEIVEFIFKIDWMGTKEFCEFAGFPVPYFQAGKSTQELAQQFVTVDAIRWKRIIEFAKQVKRKAEQALNPKKDEI